MASPSPKIIAVIGATGNQGSSVAKTFASLPNWHVRGLTRSSSSPKAKELEYLSVEIIEADLGNPESLDRALRGVHAVFCNTDFWGPYRAGMKAGGDHSAICKSSYDTEVQHGLNAFAAAAKVPSIERFIYSALGPMSRASNGKYTHSSHWETKAAIVDHIFDQHDDPALTRLAEKTSLIYLGAFFSNPGLFPKLDKDSGKYAKILPGPKTVRFPLIDPAKSTGPFVRQLIEKEAVGTRLLAYDEYLSFGEILDLWAQRTGKSYSYKQTSLEEMHEITGVPYEILDGFGYLCEYEYCAGVDGVIEPHQLKENVLRQSFRAYLEKEKTSVLLGEE